MYEHLITPSKTYYYLAITIGVLGMIIFGVFLYTSLSSLSDELPQVLVPCSSKMLWLETGSYTIFYEYNSVFENKVFSTSTADITDLNVKIRRDGGEYLQIQQATTSSSYTLGGREGIGLFEFDITLPGNYLFTAEYASGSNEPKVVFAIGKEFMSKLFGMILTSIFIALISFSLCIAMIIIVYVKRKKSREHLELEYSKIGRRS